MIRRKSVKSCEMNRSRQPGSTWRVRNWGVVWWRDPLVKMEALRGSQEAINANDVLMLNRCDPALEKHPDTWDGDLCHMSAIFSGLSNFDSLPSPVRCWARHWQDLKRHLRCERSWKIALCSCCTCTRYISVLSSWKLSEHLVKSSLSWISCCGQQSSAV